MQISRQSADSQHASIMPQSMSQGRSQSPHSSDAQQQQKHESSPAQEPQPLRLQWISSPLRSVRERAGCLLKLARIGDLSMKERAVTGITWLPGVEGQRAGLHCLSKATTQSLSPPLPRCSKLIATATDGGEEKDSTKWSYSCSLFGRVFSGKILIQITLVARQWQVRLHGGGGLQWDQALSLEVEDVLLLKLLHLDQLLLEGQLLTA
ncbi:hypothetical protein EYF80_026467 [Liparis tanakae]|uniref:Uncharacterized protein n=1 Tax=Liparis tanakae TaxID=230148 RepID=A0A4Z2HCD7_9TELE|nr:hypothetical protein EYF80_026467 [Liparis tanakae]